MVVAAVDVVSGLGGAVSSWSLVGLERRTRPQASGKWFIWVWVARQRYKVEAGMVLKV